MIQEERERIENKRRERERKSDAKLKQSLGTMQMSEIGLKGAIGEEKVLPVLEKWKRKCFTHFQKEYLALLMWAQIIKSQ